MGPGQTAGAGPEGPLRAEVLFDLQRFADGERTEPATPRRREQARQRGQVARSADLSLGLGVLAAALVLQAGVRLAVDDVLRLSGRVWGGELWLGELSAPRLEAMAWDALATLRGVGLIAAGVSGVALLTQVAQVGVLASGHPLVPQWSRIDPLAGLRRLFSARSVVELGKGLAKAAAVAWAAWGVIVPVVQSGPGLVEMSPVEVALWVGGLAWRAMVRMGLVLLLIGVADYAYQRWEFEQGLRMSRRELLDEFRQTEGDPHMRSRIRQRMRQLAARRMMQRVPQASVVVTNPTHVAVALEYDADRMEAPVVVAKGQELVAQRIVETAREHGVPVVHNPPLAWALYQGVDVGQAIPPELYRAVAEVLAYVYRLRRVAAGPARQGQGA